MSEDLKQLLKRCRRFVIAACEANVDVKGFDPTRHVLVKDIDAFIEKHMKDAKR